MKIIEFPKQKELKDLAFTESYKIFDDMEDLANAYMDEIIKEFAGIITGRTSLDEVKTLITRALWSAYTIGVTEDDSMKMFMKENIRKAGK